MLKIFRTNQILIGSLFIIPIILLHLQVFFVPTTYTSVQGGMLSDWILSIATPTSIVGHILAMLLVLIQSFLLSHLVIKFRFLERDNLFAGLLYVILAALLPHFLYLNPYLLSNTFAIWSTYEILKIYKKNKVAINIFNAGFLLGIATLLQPSYIILILPVIISINIQRSFSPKEWLMALIGLVIPIFYGYTYYFWHGIQEQYSSDLFGAFQLIALPTFNQLFDYIHYGAIAFLLFIALLGMSSNLNRVIMETKKKVSTLYWTLLFAVIALVLMPILSKTSFLMLMPVLSILLSLGISRQKNANAQASFLFLIILVLFIQYGPLFLSK